MITMSGLRGRAWQLVRYGSVSAISTATSLAVLTGLVATGAMTAAAANVVATCVGTVPSFELNRRWVWRSSGRPSLRRQIVPFVAMSILGLGLSTIAVAVTAAEAHGAGWSNGSTAIAVALANLVAFGSVWVAQFVVLDRLLFRPDGAVQAA
jgi:putative flippase GtrA